jgi:hypothetical protein
MNEHQWFEERLPWYAAGRLSTGERDELEKHLAGCAACRADLDLWQRVAGSIRASDSLVTAAPDLAERALERVHTRPLLQVAFLRAWHLLRAQALLVQHELWPACAAVMIIGVVVALLLDEKGVIRFVAPMVAAASLAVLYGPDHDPAAELALSTPTSQWKILLARLTLVSGYNFFLTLAASLVLFIFVPANLFGTLVLAWLGPLTFLSALALLLALWIGTSNAVTIAYALWLAQYIQPSQTVGLWHLSAAWVALFSAYQRFWQDPLLLLALALPLLAAALLSAQRAEGIFSRSVV